MPVSGKGDAHRLRAADMLALAEQHEHFRKEFEELAMGYLRFAEQADRNVHMGSVARSTTQSSADLNRNQIRKLNPVEKSQ